MYCTHCGSMMADAAAACPQCGFPSPVRAPSVAPPPIDLGQDAGMRLLLPVGRSILAIHAGYLGLFAVLIFPAPIALLVGVLAVIDIRRHPKKHGLGRAIFGIVMGAAGTILLIVGVISMVAGR